MRVVSLIPSATETLVSISGSRLLVGKSADCDHPPVIGNVPVVTRPCARAASPAEADQRTRDLVAAGRPVESLDADLLRDLKPDLVLIQDQCAVCSADDPSVRAALASLDPAPRILTLNAASFEGMLDAAIAIGDATGLETEAEDAVTRWRERLHTALDAVTPYTTGPRVAVLEWTDPLFVGGHWVPQLVERAGAEHPLLPTEALAGAGAGAGAHAAHRSAPPSRQISPEELVGARPEAVVVAPCGEDLAAAGRAAETLRGQPWWSELENPKLAAVDGRLLSRPGPRLVDAQEWLVGWLNGRPELIPTDFPWIELA